MNRMARVVFQVSLTLLLGATVVFAQQAGSNRTSTRSTSSSPLLGTTPSNGNAYNGPYVQSYFYPSQGYFGFGGYYSPFINLPTLPPPYPYMPKYWWVSGYPLADPREGGGYNPSAGYAWDGVTTLILAAEPRKARVTLDGLFVGTADALGPIQLPAGEHTLRVEAAGYEPSETVLHIEAPALQQLEVRLTRAAPPAQTEPRE